MNKFIPFLISVFCLVLILPTHSYPSEDLSVQLNLGVKRIVIDPGFGGFDKGAHSCKKGIYSKDLNLEIAERLASRIRETLNLDVIMTREDDKFISLEERTAIANTNNADLFISIHTNASEDIRAFGIETYFLNIAIDDEATRVSIEESAKSFENSSDSQKIVSDLIESAKINESRRLAKNVQNSICEFLSSKYNKIKNRGSKQAPFHVLLGAHMPAIVIETSFITNPRECKRLITEEYQDKICEGIVMGVQNYISETNTIKEGYQITK